MDNTKKQPNFTKEGAIINFVYFLHNFQPDMDTIIDEVYAEKMGQHFADHVKSKLKGFVGDSQYIKPEHIFKMFVNLNTEYQRMFAEWVNNNNNCGFKGEGIIEDK